MSTDLFLPAYLLLGAAFVVVASLTAATPRLRGFGVATLIAVVILLVVGVLEELATPDSERAMGFPILLAVLAPILTAAVVWQLGKQQAPRGVQWVLGLITWGLGFVATGVIAVYLNWIIF